MLLLQHLRKIVSNGDLPQLDKTGVIHKLFCYIVVASYGLVIGLHGHLYRVGNIFPRRGRIFHYTLPYYITLFSANQGGLMQAMPPEIEIGIRYQLMAKLTIYQCRDPYAFNDEGVDNAAGPGRNRAAECFHHIIGRAAILVYDMSVRCTEIRSALQGSHGIAHFMRQSAGIFAGAYNDTWLTSRQFQYTA